MPQKRYSNVIGFDDAPFEHDEMGNVPVVGVVFTGLKLTGVVLGAVEKDGTDAAEKLADLVGASRFAEHVQLVMLQGITLAGFNVVDIHYLHQQLGLPVLAVARRRPDLAAIHKALQIKVREGAEKWTVIESLPPPEPVGHVYVQRLGLSSDEALDVVKRFAIHSHLPEPLRVAHLIAGALVRGQSRGRP